MGKEKSKKSKSYDYYDAFEDISKTCLAGAQALKDTFYEYDSKDLEKNLEIVSDLEQEADVYKHRMMEVLYKDFLPPIEREDIIQLANSMDEIMDSIEDVVIKFDMYQREKPTPEMLEFIDIVYQCVEAQSHVIAELRKFKKSKKLTQHIIEVNILERTADKFYVESVKKLYSPDSTFKGIDVLAFEQIYGLLECCCDACENAANTTESIQLKNS